MPASLMPKLNCCGFDCRQKPGPIPKNQVDETIDAIAGIVTTHLGGMAARCTSDSELGP